MNKEIKIASCKIIAYSFQRWLHLDVFMNFSTDHVIIKNTFSTLVVCFSYYKVCKVVMLSFAVKYSYIVKNIQNIVK